LEQLIELSQPSPPTGMGTGLHVPPEPVLAIMALPPVLISPPPPKQTVVPVGHDTDCRPLKSSSTLDVDWDQVLPSEVVDMTVVGPASARAPTATQLEVEEQEIPSRL